MVNAFFIVNYNAGLEDGGVEGRGVRVMGLLWCEECKPWWEMPGLGAVSQHKFKLVGCWRCVCNAGRREVELKKILVSVRGSLSVSTTCWGLLKKLAD